MSEFTSTRDSGVYAIILRKRDDLIIEMPSIGRTKLLGFLSRVRRSKMPAHRWVAGAFVAWLMAASLQASEPGTTPLPTLGTSKAVHEMTQDEAQKRYPVHLKSAVVLYYNPRNEQMFVHDATGGVFVNFKDQPPAIGVKPGDLVAVTGFSGKGRFAPVVVSPVVRRLGDGRLPAPKRVSLDVLFTGTEDGQWVELEGVVRSLRKVNNTLLVNIATGIGRTDATVYDFEGRDYQRLVDATVRITGPARPDSIAAGR